MRANVYHLHALSALHCGSGQATGPVDLPIARARATHLPIVPGSSLRGVLRAELERRDDPNARALFGPRRIGASDEAFAGALSVGDATLLLLPVRALAGVVCWTTCPFVLARYRQDLVRAGAAGPPDPPTAPAAGEAAVASETNLLGDAPTLVLEDLDLRAARSEGARAWAEHVASAIHPATPEGRGAEAARADLIERFAILPDDVFAYLAETATEVRTRIAVDRETGTVRDGQLWYEESLPAESVLWGVYALADANGGGGDGGRRGAADLHASLPGSGEVLRLGGKGGIGHGLTRFLRPETPS